VCYTYKCTNVHPYVHTNTHTQNDVLSCTYIHTYIHTYIRVYMHTNSHLSKHKYLHLYCITPYSVAVSCCCRRCMHVYVVFHSAMFAVYQVTNIVCSSKLVTYDSKSRMHIHSHTCICTRYTHARIYTLTRAYVLSHMHIHLHTCICARTHAYVLTHMYIHRHTCTCTHKLQLIHKTPCTLHKCV
jgi:hypothetical protein